MQLNKLLQLTEKYEFRFFRICHQHTSTDQKEEAGTG